MFRVMNNSELQIADYVFVTSMAVELTVKIFAEGLIFTPNAMLKVYKNGYRIRGYCISTLQSKMMSVCPYVP